MGESSKIELLAKFGTAETKRFSNLQLVAFIVLAKILLYFIFVKGDPNFGFANSVFLENPDRSEFMSPVDNLIDYGTYSLAPNGTPFAGRLPGFVVPYFILRFFFSVPISNWLLGLFILFFSVLASMRLIRMLQELTDSLPSIVGATLVLAIMPYYWFWDWSLHPNSLAASCLILGLYYIRRYMLVKNGKYLLFTGFFLAWLFMLRGFTFLFIPFAITVLFIYARKTGLSFQRTIAHLGLFILPLLISETTWIARNLISLKAFIPLQTSFVTSNPGSNSEYGYFSSTKPSMMSLRNLIDCWGGDNFWYFKNSDMMWFRSEETQISAEQQFPSSLFSGSIDPNQLEDLRKDVLLSYKSQLTNMQHDSLEVIITSKSSGLARSFKSEHALYYYFVTPFKRISNFLFKNPTQDWPMGNIFPVIIKKVLKGVSAGFYFANIGLFVFFLFTRFKSILQNPFRLLLAIFTLALVFVFAELVNAAHYSYFISGYICAAVLNVLLIAEVLRQRQTARQIAINS